VPESNKRGFNNVTQLATFITEDVSIFIQINKGYIKYEFKVQEATWCSNS